MGASGALFGLVGVLFVFGIKFRHELPEGFKRAFGTGLLPMILINLYIGYLGRGFIDNAAHLGGLASGAALALLVGYKRPGQPASVAVFWHILQAAALALVAVSFLMAVRHFHEKHPFVDEMEEVSSPTLRRDVAAYLKAINDGEQAFLDAFNKGDTSGVEAAIKALDDAPRLDETAGALGDQLKSLLMRVREMANSPEQRGQRRDTTQRRELLSDFEAWQKSSVEWGRANREKYDLVIGEENSPAKDSPAKK